MLTVLPYVLKEIFGVSQELVSENIKATYPQDGDPNYNPSHRSLSSIQMLYGKTLPWVKPTLQTYVSCLAWYPLHNKILCVYYFHLLLFTDKFISNLVT
jgi:hypothetical protein